MKYNFEVKLMQEASEFIKSQSKGAQIKIAYNIQKSRRVNDLKLLKKINPKIWEFRTSWQKAEYRLFAFWDKGEKAMIICSHGIVKKSKKTPKKEIEKL